MRQMKHSFNRPSEFITLGYPGAKVRTSMPSGFKAIEARR